MFPLGLEPRTFRVLGGCDSHYTTETHDYRITRVSDFVVLVFCHINKIHLQKLSVAFGCWFSACYSRFQGGRGDARMKTLHELQ